MRIPSTQQRSTRHAQQVWRSSLQLGLEDPDRLDSIDLSHQAQPEAEASIYVGGCHNPCEIRHLQPRLIGEDLFEIACELSVAFEHGGVDENELFRFQTTARYLRGDTQATPGNH